LFRLIISDAKEWKEAYDKLIFKWAKEDMKRVEEEAKKRPIELKKLFDINPKKLKKLYDSLRKERLQFERKKYSI
jgi:hypothetical protein